MTETTVQRWQTFELVDLRFVAEPRNELAAKDARIAELEHGSRVVAIAKAERERDEARADLATARAELVESQAECDRLERQCDVLTERIKTEGVERNIERQRRVVAEAQVQALREQLPEGMKHCKIVFIECPVGHGRLSAANWIDHGCRQCLIDSLTRALRTFGQHKRLCPKVGGYSYECDCGLFAALAQATPKETR
jgi:hypothetical protein